MIPEDVKDQLRECFCSIYGAVNMINSLVEQFGSEEEKKLALGFDWENHLYTGKMREYLGVPYYEEKK